MDREHTLIRAAYRTELELREGRRQERCRHEELSRAGDVLTREREGVLRSLRSELGRAAVHSRCFSGMLAVLKKHRETKEKQRKRVEEARTKAAETSNSNRSLQKRLERLEKKKHLTKQVRRERASEREIADRISLGRRQSVPEFIPSSREESPPAASYQTQSTPMGNEEGGASAHWSSRGERDLDEELPKRTDTHRAEPFKHLDSWCEGGREGVIFEYENQEQERYKVKIERHDGARCSIVVFDLRNRLSHTARKRLKEDLLTQCSASGLQVEEIRVEASE